MGFADYLIKARLAAQNSGKLQNSIRKTESVFHILVFSLSYLFNICPRLLRITSA